jgi:hypothetical protein
MKVTYSEKVQQAHEDYAILQQATKLLQQGLGPSGAQATAEWDRTEDERGQAVYTIRISDSAGLTAQARFSPQELRIPSHVRLRLLHAWGDVLQERSHKQLQELIGPTG